MPEESSNKTFYHGSYQEIEIGEHLTAKYDDNSYTHADETKWLEDFIESARPEDKLSRRDCVFLAESPNEIDNLGGYNDYVYIVKPEMDYTEKSDLSWYTKIALLIGDYESNLDKSIIIEAKKYAGNYWNGTPSEDPCWEYRCVSAEVILDIDEEPSPPLTPKTKKGP